jgi:hypothetical protein
VEKITIENLENKIDRINPTLVHHKIVLGSRYNYYALDLYVKHTNSMRETLITGSKRKLLIYLLGLEKSEELTRFMTPAN